MPIPAGLELMTDISPVSYTHLMCIRDSVTYIPVDTLQHAFQNSIDMGCYPGQDNYLGTLGSPRLSRISFDRRDPSEYFFTDPYDFCVQRPEDVIFTNTCSPFTNLSYYKGGGSRDGKNASNPILPSMQTKDWGLDST